MKQPQVRDLSQKDDGLTGHTSSIPKAPAPDSAVIPGSEGLAEIGFDTEYGASGDGTVKTVSTVTKVDGVQQPTVAYPNLKPAAVQCPTARPGAGTPVKGSAVYNGGNSGRFGTF
jgi:hypothetical protein